ncbi:hypothetical protein DUNSADRAFT_12288 [Dunaliella salina]|uniref:Gamma-glutamylcyclotransferase n=1 Tax=Dunaliella salina TaxID=3046 RepID=A0ABQ7H420_DUNSA|nr:hypothetical protein DUNSADRAFT_12288 [Dunaliella salina]|eukprot:KAF5841590.1 hypothetical protein DUNSADRAFT_12288 [Dunaliella salina]
MNVAALSIGALHSPFVSQRINWRHRKPSRTCQASHAVKKAPSSSRDVVTHAQTVEKPSLEELGGRRKAEDQQQNADEIRGSDSHEEDGSTAWFFAYGYYMSFASLQKKGVKAQFRDAAVIKDPELKMVFRHKGGQATLERMPARQSPRFPPLVSL